MDVATEEEAAAIRRARERVERMGNQQKARVRRRLYELRDDREIERQHAEVWEEA